MDALVLLISFLLVAGAGRTSHADSKTAMDYWQTLLPQAPMPPAILDLLNRDAGSNNLKLVKVISNLKDAKKINDASQAKEDLKEIYVASLGNKEEISGSYGLKRKQNKMKAMTTSLKKILAVSPHNEDNLNEISVSYGSKLEEDVKEISVSYGLEGKQDLKKVSLVDLKKILTTRPRNEENLKEISVSYGSKLEEDLKEISMSYGLEGKQDSKKLSVVDLKKFLAASQRDEENLNEISVSYGSKLVDDLKEISVSYGLEGAKDLKEISVSYGIKGEEDVKEISVSYGQEDEDGIKELTASYGSMGDKDGERRFHVHGHNDRNKKIADEDGIKEITASYGSMGDIDGERHFHIHAHNDRNKKIADEDGIKEVTASYGSMGDKDGERRFHVHAHNNRNKKIADGDGIKEVTASYGSIGDKDGERRFSVHAHNNRNKKIAEEDGIKEVTVSYGSMGDKDGERRFHVHAHNDRNKKIADVFFFHHMLRPGTMMTPTIPPTSSLPALLPRHIASSIPFSAKRFPDIVAMFAPASLAMAGAMRWTLDTCEYPRPLPGQKAGCATSLESLAELPASLLGTRNVRAFSADMPIEPAGTSALRARYNVTAARKLSKSLDVVTCHDLTYPYAVFYCHTASPTAAYMVKLESEDGAAPAMEVLAVCHLDTSQWNPENPFFKLHGVNPGEVSVCHFLSKLSNVWVRSGDGELEGVRAAE
ncbi:unnamed protein product [Alopecurus aequalis]